MKALVNTLPYFFEIIGKDVTFQIIFSTHDPLSLSDIPNHNVTYIKSNDETGISDILEDSEISRPKVSFGANITDLLSDSFSSKMV
ncbi:MAG: hypothetical protein IPH46_16090 [Bacteroidetes bacterium]|nr:hypothetical protein [Bacteroidota bacterium]